MSMRSNALASAGVREWMNQNSTVVTVAAVLLLVIAIGAVVIQGWPDDITPPDEAYFYVPETKELFSADSKLVPPIDRNGKKAVKAHFYGCGDCDDASRFPGYYEKYSDAAKAQLDKINEQMRSGQEIDPDLEMQVYELAMTQRFFSADGEKWVLAESPQGQEMQEKMREKCGTAKLVYCSP